MVLDPADHDTWSAGSFFTNPIITAGRLPEGRRGREFSDSEVYKFLEAAAWQLGHPDDITTGTTRITDLEPEHAHENMSAGAAAGRRRRAARPAPAGSAATRPRQAGRPPAAPARPCPAAAASARPARTAAG